MMYPWYKKVGVQLQTSISQVHFNFTNYARNALSHCSLQKGEPQRNEVGCNNESTDSRLGKAQHFLEIEGTTSWLAY